MLSRLYCIILTPVPLFPSVALSMTLTGDVYHPLLPMVPYRVQVVTGGVLSMLMGWVLTNTLLPARSVAVPLTTCPVQSFVNIMSCVMLLMPDTLSEAMKCTVTFCVYIPLTVL